MSTTSRYPRTVVYRHLNYRWTLLGLEASAWLAVVAPAAVYLASAQLLQPWAGAVPWPAWRLAAALGGGVGTAWAAACGVWVRPGWAAGVGMGACCAPLGWLALTGRGLPAWPACSLVAGAATYAVGLQLRRPPGALGRLVAGLWAPHQLLAGPCRREAGARPSLAPGTPR